MSEVEIYKKQSFMKFGNWNVTENNVEWAGKNGRFVIPAEELIKTKEFEEVGVLYEWILTATQQHWLTQNDLYDLNYAFVYAAAKWNVALDYEIFDATLADQYDQFDAEDADDLEL
jgi:hypothetical protein